MNVSKPSTRTWLVPTLYGSATLVASCVLFWLCFTYKPELGIIAIALLFLLLPAAAELQLYFMKRKFYEIQEAFDAEADRLLTNKHKSLRQQILTQLDLVKPKLGQLDHGGYVDDDLKLLIVDTDGAVMVSLTLDSTREFNLYRDYAIHTDGDELIRTINDASVRSVDGDNIVIGKWRTPSAEWMRSLDNVASDIELQELSSYLEQIIQYA